MGFIRDFCQSAWDFYKPSTQVQDFHRIFPSARKKADQKAIAVLTFFKKKVDTALAAYGAPDPKLGPPGEPTIDDLREASITNILEAQRLEAIEPKKTVYTIRLAGEAQFRFADKSERECRFWALATGDPDLQLFKETWVIDPQDNKLRSLKKEPLDFPVRTAQESHQKVKASNERNVS